MKKLISCLLILALALSLTACGFSLGGGKGAPAAKAKEQKLSLSAAVTREDGTAYVATEDGGVIKINDEVEAAALSPDRKTLVVLLKDGTLYYTDPEQSEKHQIADNAEYLAIIRDDGALYSDADGKIYRVALPDGEIESLGTDVDGFAADDTLVCLLFDEGGGVYIYKPGEGSPEKIGRCQGDPTSGGITNDAGLAIWGVREDEKTVIYAYENEERSTIASIDSTSIYITVTFTEDQGLAVISDTDMEELYLKKPGEEAVKVRLGNELASETIYCQSGLLSEAKTADVSMLYVAVEADKGQNLYAISVDGERERVLSGINDFAVSDGRLVYRNDENTLYFAQLDGAELKDETKIASDVDLFRVQGEYVYYYRNCDDVGGTLYCRKLSEADGDPVKIATEVGVSIGSWYSYDYLYVTESGETVFYLRTLEDVKDSYQQMGTLYRWSWGDEEPLKIASDVVEDTLTSLLQSGFARADHLWFMKYDSTNDDGDLVGDLYFFDGSETTKLASEIVY